MKRKRYSYSIYKIQKEDLEKFFEDIGYFVSNTIENGVIFGENIQNTVELVSSFIKKHITRIYNFKEDRLKLIPVQDKIIQDNGFISVYEISIQKKGRKPKNENTDNFGNNENILSNFYFITFLIELD